ncbi:MAG TPA: DNA repair protein RecN, partial [Alphaproteobacteria bacterium]|nr:DNA repair protein RecN [Alphaproteobacteria bacterium]
MLTGLDIQNVVLIDRLSLEGDGGLVALTGETGAGKSILLDALGLALGARAEAGLVRHGTPQATVTASFDLPPHHAVLQLLSARGIESDGTLILRRAVNKDGRSKAFINDAPVSVQLLKETGALLIEIHGQFDTQGLLDPAGHGAVLDEFAGTTADAAAVRRAYAAWRDAMEKLDDAKAGIEATRLQEEYLRYTVAELEALAPEAGEEAILAEKRQRLMNREKLAEGFEQAQSLLTDDAGLQSQIGRLEAVLEKLAAKSENQIRPLLENLSRAKGEIDDMSWQIDCIMSGADDGDERLEDIEERFFALKDCAKKHRCTPDDLPAVLTDLAQRLRLITHQDDALAELQAAVSAARQNYADLAGKLSTKRQKAAGKLAKAVNTELPALKLEKAKFDVAV